ncbi:MAG: triose-phosphate isomerase [Planctomycetes bacterium]|nr:triose-phosphate isomerase [Planctomycetota bacterium]
MRRPVVGGNWKMHGTLQAARDLARALAARLGRQPAAGAEIVVFPPAVHLVAVVEELKGTAVGVGAQNAHFAASGAYTGEVSPTMILDAGAAWALLGHSERRHFEGGAPEDDALLNRKLKAALAAGMRPVLCIGETLAERESGRTEAVLGGQLSGSLAGLSSEELVRTVLAYEPVWAIGTGKTATPETAQEAHAFVRRWLAGRFSAETAGEVRVQYGGSVKPENAAALMAMPDVDGALVGGASLAAAAFAAIVTAARR